MYNWITDLENIYYKLESNDFLDLKEELYESQLSGGSGLEIFLLITTTLKKLKKEHPNAFEYIREEANRIFNYGLDNGFISEKGGFRI